MVARPENLHSPDGMHEDMSYIFAHKSSESWTFESPDITLQHVVD
jgi:hypothetical protein